MMIFAAKILYFVFLLSFAYFLALMCFYILLAFFGIGELKKREQESMEEDYPAVYLSTFAIPVSIILPAHNEELWIKDAVLSVINQNYPKFEVIIVDDGSTDRTFEVLCAFLDLKPVDMLYVKHYKDGQVKSILRSDKYPNVTVIHKFSGLKKAGALNAGLNIAQYEFICTMDSDTVLEQNALLRVMAQVMKDPENTVGIGSYFSLSNGTLIKDGRVIKADPVYSTLVAYQNLEYIRSFMGNRIAWSKFNTMPVVAGGFAMWRRDLLYELGGFDKGFTCEDIEFTFRVHEHLLKNKKNGYKIVMLPYHVGWTEGPENVVALVSQRERWQRVTDETIWRYKHMLFNPRYGWFAFMAMPYFVFYEGLGVFFEVLSLAFVTFGWVSGLLDIKTFIAFLLLMILSQTFISLLSVFSFVRTQRTYSFAYISYLTALSFAEFFLYRWILTVGKIQGTYRYLCGVKSFDQYIRSKRVV